MAMGKVGTLQVMTIDTAKRADCWQSAYLVTLAEGRAQRVVFYEDLGDQTFGDRLSAARHALKVGLHRAETLARSLLGESRELDASVAQPA